MPPVKPFLDHPDLIEGLVDSGVEISDRDEAGKALRKYGYHRLSGYRYLFRNLLPRDERSPSSRKFRSKKHQAGTQFEDIIALAEFDRDLRLCVMSATEDFEVRLRTAVAHVLARRNELAHLHISCLDAGQCNKITRQKGQRSHDIFIQTVQAVTKRALNENDDFAIHHTQTYGPELPVWAIVEHLSFGSLVQLLVYLKPSDKREVARKFGVEHPAPFVKWVRALSSIRNNAAHGVRLFNKPLKHTIRIPTNATRFPLLDEAREHLEAHSHQEESASPAKRVYAHAAVLAYMLQTHESSSRWPREFAELITQMPAIFTETSPAPLVTPEKNMGFPDGWQRDHLWQLSRA